MPACTAPSTVYVPVVMTMTTKASENAYCEVRGRDRVLTGTVKCAAEACDSR